MSPIAIESERKAARILAYVAAVLFCLLIGLQAL